MLAFVDEKKSDHFFYNTEYLIGFHKAGKKRENHWQDTITLPSYKSLLTTTLSEENSSWNIELRKDELKGLYDTCDFCKKKTVLPCPRPFPDYSCLPEYKYFDCNNTPMDNRKIEDFQPRAELKNLYKDYKISGANEGLKEKAMLQIRDIALKVCDLDLLTSNLENHKLAQVKSQVLIQSYQM